MSDANKEGGANAPFPAVTPSPLTGRIVGADLQAQTLTIEGEFCEVRAGAYVQIVPVGTVLSGDDKRVMEAWRTYFGEMCDALFPEGVGRPHLLGWKHVIERARALAQGTAPTGANNPAESKGKP